jgi:phosphatidylinositol alpha-1,6-mannosyltransferase
MSKKERFHLLLSGDFPPVPGGESRFLSNVFYFLPTPHKAVITPYDKGAEEIDDYLPFPVKRIHLWKKAILKPFFPLVYFFSASVFRKEKLLVHCGQAMVPGIAGLLTKFFLRAPYVLYAYGSEFLKYVRFPYNVIFKIILKNAYKIITISHYTTSQVKKLGIPDNKIIQTLLGVNTQKFYPSHPDPEIRRKHGLEEKRIIMSTCRLVELKGVDMVISAMIQVLRAVPNAVYLIVGSGEDRERLENIATEKGVIEKVIFAGYVSDETLLAFYNLSSLYIQPSREMLDMGSVEGFGISFVEASACGKPVIGGRSGGVGDAVIDGVTGILVDAENVDEISQAIIRLLKNNELAERLGKQGLERVQNELSWDKIAHKLYERL